MAYKNLNKNYNPASYQGVKTNLPIEPIQSVDNTKKTMRIFGDYFDNAVTINSAEYDAVISFFTKKDFTLIVLDQLSATNPQELSDIIAEILNLYRFKSSLIGIKQDNPTPNVVSRNILG